MLADISHELRTPLTTMRGYLDTLEMPEIVLDEDKRRRYIETARRETLRLERIVADLLELARFENGVAAIEARVVAVEHVLTGVARRYERDAAAANVAIRTRVHQSADQVVADPDRLDQAISISSPTRCGTRRREDNRTRGDCKRRQLSVDSDRFGQRIAPSTSRTCSNGSTRSIIAVGRDRGKRARPLDRQGDCRASRRHDFSDQPARTDRLRHHAAADGDLSGCTTSRVALTSLD